MRMDNLYMQDREDQNIAGAWPRYDGINGYQFKLKGPFCDPIILIVLTQFSRLIQKKLISKFSGDSDVSFVSYEQFTSA